MSPFFSPHIFIYKPQTNSVFSLFLRFILIIVFLDFIAYSLSFSFFNSFIFRFLLDNIFLSEVVAIFYIISMLGEDFIDYDSIDLNYWDIDLVTFFRFFFMFFLILMITLFAYLLLKAIFWSNLVFY